MRRSAGRALGLLVRARTRVKPATSIEAYADISARDRHVLIMSVSQVSAVTILDVAAAKSDASPLVREGRALVWIQMTAGSTRDTIVRWRGRR